MTVIAQRTIRVVVTLKGESQQDIDEVFRELEDRALWLFKGKRYFWTHKIRGRRIYLLDSYLAP